MLGTRKFNFSVQTQYKVLVTVFTAYHSGNPQYLADLMKKHSPVRKLRSSHNPYWRNLNIPEKGLDPSLSVLQDHVSGTDFLLNSGRLVHWTHSRNIICSKILLHRKLTLINFSYLYCMNCTYPIACYERSIIAAY